MNSEGVYELSRLERLPNDNHEKDFWFVALAKLNEVELGTSGRSLSNVFGVGLFHYDDLANTQRAIKADTMQTDPIFEAMRDDDLVAGCVNTQGNLRASCNLVCWTLVESLLTGNIGESKTLMVHHVSVATVANETQTEIVDRYQARRRRRTLAAEGDVGEMRPGQEHTRLLTVRSAEQPQTSVPVDDPAPAPVSGPTTVTGGIPPTQVSTANTDASFVREILVGLIVGFSVVVWFFLLACCFLCMNMSYRRSKKGRRF
jgi:hypothetical protein